MGDDLPRPLLGIGEIQRQGTPGGDVFRDQRFIAADDDLNAQPFRRRHEIGGPVGGGGNQQKQAIHAVSGGQTRLGRVTRRRSVSRSARRNNTTAR